MRSIRAVPVVLLLTLSSGCGYNRIAQEEQHVESSWGQVENQLQRRADLIPNLVRTVQGYAAHEKEILEAVAKANSAFTSATTREGKIEAAGQMDVALGRFMTVVQGYPQLKADASFIRLMDELAGTENRIAVERKRYNDAVETYNADVRGIPGAWWARMGGFPSHKDYFKAQPGAAQAPQVNFQ